MILFIMYFFNDIYFTSGTSLFYQPGLLIGGNFDHDCNPERAIGYYVEALICLAPFMKEPMKAILRGVTNDQRDPSVSIQLLRMMPGSRLLDNMNLAPIADASALFEIRTFANLISRIEVMLLPMNGCIYLSVTGLLKGLWMYLDELLMNRS